MGHKALRGREAREAIVPGSTSSLGTKPKPVHPGLVEKRSPQSEIQPRLLKEPVPKDTSAVFERSPHEADDEVIFGTGIASDTSSKGYGQFLYQEGMDLTGVGEP